MKLQIIVLFALLLALPVIAQEQASEEGGNIVHSIVKAPISPDGTVAGGVTDFVINLDRSMDPNEPGRTLLQGKTIRIQLPAAFRNRLGLPFASVGSPECGTGPLQCNTGVLLQGWPQHPIAPPAAKYSFEYDAATNAIIYTALEDLVPDLPLEPGLKQMHLIFLGFTNPAAGSYEIGVVAETGPDGAEETGRATLHILPAIRPSINITSVFNEGTPNTIYQEALPGEMTPLPYDFLLWNEEGLPLEGVTISNIGAGGALIMQGEWVIGRVLIDAPEGASGYEIFTEAPSEAMNAPVLGIPTAHLRVFFRAGDVPGDYVITLMLDGGNVTQRFVTVQ